MTSVQCTESQVAAALASIEERYLEEAEVIFPDHEQGADHMPSGVFSYMYSEMLCM